MLVQIHFAPAESVAVQETAQSAGTKAGVAGRSGACGLSEPTDRLCRGPGLGAARWAVAYRGLVEVETKANRPYRRPRSNGLQALEAFHKLEPAKADDTRQHTKRKVLRVDRRKGEHPLQSRDIQDCPEA